MSAAPSLSVRRRIGSPYASFETTGNLADDMACSPIRCSGMSSPLGRFETPQMTANNIMAVPHPLEKSLFPTTAVMRQKDWETWQRRVKQEHKRAIRAASDPTGAGMGPESIEGECFADSRSLAGGRRARSDTALDQQATWKSGVTAHTDTTRASSWARSTKREGGVSWRHELMRDGGGEAMASWLPRRVITLDADRRPHLPGTHWAPTGRHGRI